MEDVFRIFFDLRNVKLNPDDDSADRISRLFSALLVIILATIVSARQCLGEAIHCWCPENCATNHEKYANLMCWVDDTYYVPFSDRVLHPDEVRQRKVTYYQWIPIILMLQAMLFVAPWVVWKALAGKSGVHLGSIVEAASKSQLSSQQEDREVAFNFAVYLLERFLTHRRQTYSCFKKYNLKCVSCASNCSTLYASYLLVKMLYLINAVGQLFLLDQFLGLQFYTFGYQVLTYLFGSKGWIPTDRFPHVTLCDFQIRQGTNVHQYTVQCVLPINIFNEKVFAVIWFWLVMVALVTFVSLLKWVWCVLFAHSVFRFVKKNLDMVGYLSIEDKVEYQSLRIFSNSYLGRDGIFVLRLVAANAGELVAAEILGGLWMRYGHNCHRIVPEKRFLGFFRKPKRVKQTQLQEVCNRTTIHSL